MTDHVNPSLPRSVLPASDQRVDSHQLIQDSLYMFLIKMYSGDKFIGGNTKTSYI